jgi:hypothetical protein
VVLLLKRYPQNAIKTSEITKIDRLTKLEKVLTTAHNHLQIDTKTSQPLFPPKKSTIPNLTPRHHIHPRKRKRPTADLHDRQHWRPYTPGMMVVLMVILIVMMACHILGT